MGIVVTAACMLAFAIFTEQTWPYSAEAYYGYNTRRPKKYSAGAAAYSDVRGPTVYALDSELSKQFQNILNDHTQKIIQNTQDEIQRSFANSQKFANDLSAKINADVQRSLASAFGGFGGFGNPGGYGMNPEERGEDPTANFNNNLMAGIQNSIANSKRISKGFQDNINDVLRKAAKSGKMKIIKGNGPGAIVSSASTFGDGQSVIVSGGSDADGMVVYSNQPVSINGRKYMPKN